MKAIKAVLMDGDGSTITSEGVVPDNLRQFIIDNPQIKWIMVTGRSLEVLRHASIVDLLSMDVPHVLDGGSRLMKLSGDVIKESYISDKELDIFFERLSLDLIEFIHYSLDHARSFFYAPDLSKWRNDPFFMHANLTSCIHEFKAYTNFHRPTKILVRVTKETHFYGLYYNKNELYIDITAHGVNKGSASRDLLNLLELKPSEVAFVFNDKNDLPVILHEELKGITTIKVGDYLPEIMADYTAKTPYDVANILVKLIS